MQDNIIFEGTNLTKKCNMCLEHLPLSKFGRKTKGYLGVKARCKECLNMQQKKFYSESPEYRKYQNEYTNTWRNNNKERASEIAMKNKIARKNQKIRRRTLKSYLPNELTTENLANLLDGISEGYHVDHFLPLSIGHGGTYLGNLIVIPSSWNVTKSAKNPFEWCEEKLTIDEKEGYIKKVTYLANLNGMSLSEFEKYTYWCFSNPRTIEDLQKEIERNGFVMNSIELYKIRSKNEY